MAHHVCRRLGLSARVTVLAVTLTALHLKIGLMSTPARTTHPKGLPGPRDPSEKKSRFSLGPTVSPPEAHV